MVAQDELQARYDELRADAERRAGSQAEVPRRAAVLLELYRSSGGNHVLPLVAAHVSLWGHRRFPPGRSGPLGDHFRAVNRAVCVGTDAAYRFAGRYGRESHAAAVLPPDLLAALTQAAGPLPLDDDGRRAVYRAAVRWEQGVVVADATGGGPSGGRLLRAACRRPVVRLAFFPWWGALWFRDATDPRERVAQAMRAFAFARRRGWDRVVADLRGYGVPLADPDGHHPHWSCPGAHPAV